jgi:flavin reductase (DIM6/NTAB) family NADH-FMN oxidoreductase RutF
MAGNRAADHEATRVSLDARDFAPSEMYFLLRDTIVPRPIAWVSTVDVEGRANLAPFSFFAVCSPWPPSLGFSCGPRGDDHGRPDSQPKDTLVNIRAVGEFVINLVPQHLLATMVATADDLPHGVSEFAHAAVEAEASLRVRPPRVAVAPVAFECRLNREIPLGTNTWIIGDVVAVHFDHVVHGGIGDGRRHRIDLLANERTRPIGRLGRAEYVRLSDRVVCRRRDGPN